MPQKQEEKITIQELALKLMKKLVQIKNLHAIYVGKTQNIESTKSRHNIDYDKITFIAIGSPTTISKAEDYLIKYLKNSFKDRINVDNHNTGSAGNNDANMLYVCLDYSPNNIEDLYDDDLFDRPFTLIDF